MYKWSRLNKKNWSDFKSLHKNNYDFNPLNKDFIRIYKESNPLKQKFLLRKVLLLKDQSEQCIGYIWPKSYSNKYELLSLNVLEHKDINLYKDCFWKVFKNGSRISYECVKNPSNYNILKYLGFKIESGITEMSVTLDSPFNLKDIPDISFVTLMKGYHEELRCNMQNKIFESDCRVPLDINDIHFDEFQDYYIDDGAVFIKYKDEFIGYGQLIDDEKGLTIVNFGIIKEYRRCGYGKYLLAHLLDHAYKNYSNKINIMVNYDNIPAIELYKTFGFITDKTILNWEYNNLKYVKK